MFDILETNGYSRLNLQNRFCTSLTKSQAFEVSIAKWELLYQLCRQGKLVDDGGIQTCGLCLIYFYGHTDECEDCPITGAGQRGCAGTPYKDYVRAVENENLELAIQAALEEIRFLKGFCKET